MNLAEGLMWIVAIVVSVYAISHVVDEETTKQDNAAHMIANNIHKVREASCRVGGPASQPYTCTFTFRAADPSTVLSTKHLRLLEPGEELEE